MILSRCYYKSSNKHIIIKSNHISFLIKPIDGWSPKTESDGRTDGRMSNLKSYEFFQNFFFIKINELGNPQWWWACLFYSDYYAMRLNLRGNPEKSKKYYGLLTLPSKMPLLLFTCNGPKLEYEPLCLWMLPQMIFQRLYLSIFFVMLLESGGLYFSIYITVYSPN